MGIKPGYDEIHLPGGQFHVSISLTKPTKNSPYHPNSPIKIAFQTSISLTIYKIPFIIILHDASTFSLEHEHYDPKNFGGSFC